MYAFRFASLSALCALLLLSACIRLGGCHRDQPFDGADVRIHFEVNPKQGYDDLYGEVFLDDQLVGTIGNRGHIDLTVPAGMHEIKVDAPGHRHERKTVLIMDTIDRSFTSSFELTERT